MLGVESNEQLTSESAETLANVTVESNSLDASDTFTGDQPVDDILVLRSRLEMQCREIIAAANASTSREALLCAIKHTRTAYATFKGVERNAPPNFNIAKRNPPNKKLSSQARFFSTKIRRRKILNCLRKPNAADIAVAKKKLSTAKCRVVVHPNAVVSPFVPVQAEITTELNDLLQPNVVRVNDEGLSLLGDDCNYSGGEHIPYCIDTETVSCETVPPVHTSLKYKLRLRRPVCRIVTNVASAPISPAQVTSSLPKTGRSSKKRVRFDRSMPYLADSV